MHLGLRKLIFMLVLLAMPVAAYMFVFEPRTSQISDAKQNIAAKRMKLQELEAATRRFADLDSEIEKLSSAIELFEQKLPPRREEQVILQQVWQLAAKHSLLPKSIRPDKPVATAQYAELPIQLAITGNFDGFYHFILELERLSRITRMPKLELVQLPNTNGDVTVLMTLSIFFESQEDQNATSAGRPKWRTKS